MKFNRDELNIITSIMGEYAEAHEINDRDLSNLSEYELDCYRLLQRFQARKKLLKQADEV